MARWGSLVHASVLAAALSACVPASSSNEEPAWSDAALTDLAAAAGRAALEGLPSETAAIAEIDMLRQSAGADAAARALLDQSAEDLFVRLANAYAQGATDPALDPAWHIPRAAAPDLEGLLTARAAGAPPSTLLDALKPSAAEYAALGSALEQAFAEAPETTDGAGRRRDARIASLRASLERWRWLPRDMPMRRIDVLTPHFEVVLRDGETHPRHAAIVGARDTQTPSFAAMIQAVTLNPTWTPPRSILVNELLPRFRRDPAAADRENYEVLDSAGRIVPLGSVNWAARPFPYTLRQRAGAGNALGQIKFEMPNAYGVYLHDTPSRSLFARADRALSHGCVRVEDPVGLAAVVLGADWSAETLRAAIAEGATRRMPLAQPLPVYALYMTAIADGADIRYADDIYGRDAAIVAALDAPDAALAVAAAPAATARCPA